MSKFTLAIEAESMDELLSLVSANGLAGALGGTEKREVVTHPVEELRDEQERVAAENGYPSPTDTGNDEEFDKLGMPWDERIHASSKAKNKDGTWRYKRGVEKALVEQVEAELKGGSLPTNKFPEIPEALQRGPVAPPSAPDPTPVSQTDATYEQVVAALTQALQSDPPKLTADQLPQFYLECGVADVNALRSDQNALNTALAKLQEM